MTLQEFKTKVDNSPRRDDIRRGQHAFNLLFSANPRIADRIRGSYSDDPFFDDDKLPAFWKAVEGMWGDE